MPQTARTDGKQKIRTAKRGDGRKLREEAATKAAIEDGYFDEEPETEEDEE